MEWAVPSTGGRRVVVFSLRCSSLESRVTWIFAPRSHHAVISTLSPDPRSRSICNSKCAVLDFAIHARC
jgi:hypothetical protein